jgi:hypothetical protein
MKNELTEFLPVAPFWRKQKPSRKVERAFCWGIVVGCLITVAVTVAIILL